MFVFDLQRLELSGPAGLHGSGVSSEDFLDFSCRRRQRHVLNRRLAVSRRRNEPIVPYPRNGAVRNMIYRFADCELDIGVHELRHGGNVRAVEPQVFDLLHYLVENRNRLVTRDELFENIWQGRFVRRLHGGKG